MINFEKYVEHVKFMFKPYKRCIVKEKVKKINREIITIVPVDRPSDSIQFGELGIIFDEETIGFFGDFFPDDYIDWNDNSWKKYSEKEMFEFLDKKIAEYKYYIDNGYFFVFYNKNNEIETVWPDVYTGDFDKIDYKKEYLDQLTSDNSNYCEIKKVTVTNFYGDVVVQKNLN